MELPLYSTNLEFSQENSEAILNWMSPLDYRPVQLDIYNRRYSEPGTGEWLLQTVKFGRWLDGVDRILWCYGMRTPSYSLYSYC